LQIRPVFTEFNPEEAKLTSLDEYFVVNIPAENLCKIDEITNRLLATGAVDYIEKNEVMRLSPVITADKGDMGKLSVNDPEASKLWGMEKMNLDELHEFLKKYKNAQEHRKVRIAILDTGVEAEHEDLRGAYVSLRPEYDYDKMGHGTHCAGIAAAVSNNGIGIASFAPSASFVEVTSVKVLSDQGWGTQEDIIKGIIFAADNGADVISMSLGGPSDDATQAAYEEAVRYANRKGAIVVVAAGNSDENAKYYAPANVNGVITVAALSNTLNKADFSNTVEDLKMGIAAPGVDIYSTFIKNEYKYLSGTSMATPYAAGLLGMMKWIKPDLTTEEAYEILHDTGLNTVAGKKTGRLIQAKACLKLAESL
jgi:thermitase